MILRNYRWHTIFSELPPSQSYIALKSAVWIFEYFLQIYDAFYALCKGYQLRVEPYNKIEVLDWHYSADSRITDLENGQILQKTIPLANGDLGAAVGLPWDSGRF